MENASTVDKLFVEAVGRYCEGAVLCEEAAGQQTFLESEMLPAEMEPVGARAALEAAGVKFIGPVEDDPLFFRVTLPGGWRKVPTTEARLSMLVDNQGRERARLFYKAASYDRKAALILQPRYGIQEESDLLGWRGPIVVIVTDGRMVLGGGELFRTEPSPPLTDRRERFRARREAVKQAEAWLDAHYPDWRNPLAYWD